MQKLLAIFALLVMLGSAAAGCVGDETPGTGEDDVIPIDSDGDGVFDDEDAFPNDANETADGDGDGVGDNSDAFPADANESVDTDGDGTGDNADETPEGEPTLTPLSTDQALEMLSMIDVLSEGENMSQWGVEIVIDGPLDTGMGEPQDAVITLTQIRDDAAQMVMNSMTVALMEGLMNIEITEIQGPGADGTGIVNIRATQIDPETMTPGQIQAHWLIDHDWEYADAVESLLGDGEEGGGDGGYSGAANFVCGDGEEVPFDWVNDGMEDCDDGSDEPQDTDGDGTYDNWFDCHDGTQIGMDEVNDGFEDCYDGEDEGGEEGQAGPDEGDGMDPGLEAPSEEELASMNWTTAFDETTGLQTFSATMDMEDNESMDITLTLIPSTPPIIQSVEMADDTTLQTITMLYGDALNIDLVSEETTGWMEGASDMQLMVSAASSSDGVNFNSSVHGSAYGMFEVPTSQLALHILTEGGYDEDGAELPQDLLAGFDLTDLEAGTTWTDADGAEWSLMWTDVDADGLVGEDDELAMSTTDETNASFDVALYDSWAEDYTGSLGLPGFGIGLSLIAALGACLLLRRKEL